MSFLILAHPNDSTALRVASRLRARHGSDLVQLRTGDELVLARWEHRVSSEGTSCLVQFHDGAVITNSTRTVIFNRLTVVENAAFADASNVDREYARMETFALLLSWLASDRHRVVNPPSPINISGTAWRPFVWQHLALNCGFANLDVCVTTSSRRFPPGPGMTARNDMGLVSDPLQNLNVNEFGCYSSPASAPITSVFVIGGQVIGDVSASTRDACARLAAVGHVDLLRIDLVSENPGAQGSGKLATFIAADSSPAVEDSHTLEQLVQYLETLNETESSSA